MKTNQIILIIIVVLLSIIIVVGVYYLANYLLNKKMEKKEDNVFHPNNLVEEESLMNMLDTKKNIEYNTKGNDQERFVLSNDEVPIITNKSMSQEQKINPFGIDMTMHSKDGTTIEIEDIYNKNKFIK